MLINALGFSTNENKIAARELLALVVGSGGKVKTFSHLKDEVAGILTKYARDPYSRATMRLEFFDFQCYGETDVMRHRGNLESTIARLGVEIVDASSYIEKGKGAKSCSYSVDALRTILKEQLGYSMGTASIDNDILSVRSIFAQRGHTQSYGIEACRAILVTTNPAFTKTANDFFKMNGKRGETGVAIDDYDLTALLWLRSWSKKSNLSKLLLLQGAYAACKPSADLIEAFALKVEKLKREDQIDENDALILRTQAAPREELLVLSENDVNAVTDAMVIEIRDKYRMQLTKERDQQIAVLQGELSAERHKKLRALTEAEEEAHKESRIFHKRISIATTISFVLAFLLGSGLIVYEYFSADEGSLGYIWRGILSLIGVLGLFDLLFSRKPVLRSWIERLEYRKFSKLYSNKVAKIEIYFG